MSHWAYPYFASNSDQMTMVVLLRYTTIAKELLFFKPLAAKTWLQTTVFPKALVAINLQLSHRPGSLNTAEPQWQNCNYCNRTITSKWITPNQALPIFSSFHNSHKGCSYICFVVSRQDPKRGGWNWLILWKEMPYIWRAFRFLGSDNVKQNSMIQLPL